MTQVIFWVLKLTRDDLRLNLIFWIEKVILMLQYTSIQVHVNLEILLTKPQVKQLKVNIPNNLDRIEAVILAKRVNYNNS